MHQLMSFKLSVKLTNFDHLAFALLTFQAYGNDRQLHYILFFSDSASNKFSIISILLVFGVGL